MEKIPMTAAGYAVLETELKHRQQVERPRIIQQITDARTHGDLSENAEYHAAKETQSLNEGRIAELEDKLRQHGTDRHFKEATQTAYGGALQQAGVIRQLFAERLDAFKWEWAEVPKKFEWKEGDYIYIPPFTTHQHFATAETRLIMMSNRIVKEMGFDWFDQVESAPGFEAGQQPAR